MAFLTYPEGTVVVVPWLYRGRVCIVRGESLVSATNEPDLQEEATAFLRAFGESDLDGGPIHICPPELAAKAIFPDASEPPPYLRF